MYVNNDCMYFNDNQCIENENVCNRNHNRNANERQGPDCNGHLNCIKVSPRIELAMFRGHVIHVTCGGRELECVADSGADISTIGSSLIRDGSILAVTYPSKLVLCVLADGDSIPVLGEAVVTCQMGSVNHKIRFIVIDNKDTSQVIIGCDFLEGVNAIIDFKQSKLIIDKVTNVKYQNEIANLERGDVIRPTNRVNIVCSGYVGGNRPRSYRDALLTNLQPPGSTNVDVPTSQGTRPRRHVTSSESWTPVDQPPVTSCGPSFAHKQNPTKILNENNHENMKINSNSNIIGTATSIKPVYCVRGQSRPYNHDNMRMHRKPPMVPHQTNIRYDRCMTERAYSPRISNNMTANMSRANTLGTRNDSIVKERHSSYFNNDVPTNRTLTESFTQPRVGVAHGVEMHDCSDSETECETVMGAPYTISAAEQTTDPKTKVQKPYMTWEGQQIDLSPTTGITRDPQPYSSLAHRQPPSTVTHSHVPKGNTNTDTLKYRNQLAEQEKMVNSPQYLVEFDETIPVTPPQYKYFLTKESCFSNFYTHKDGGLFCAPAYVNGLLEQMHIYDSSEVAYHHIKALRAGRFDLCREGTNFAPRQS
jgi:hypothetical protein